jgi:hypothetical protein
MAMHNGAHICCKMCFFFFGSAYIIGLDVHVIADRNIYDVINIANLRQTLWIVMMPMLYVIGLNKFFLS